MNRHCEVCGKQMKYTISTTPENIYEKYVCTNCGFETLKRPMRKVDDKMKQRGFTESEK